MNEQDLKNFIREFLKENLIIQVVPSTPNKNWNDVDVELRLKGDPEPFSLANIEIPDLPESTEL